MMEEKTRYCGQWAWQELHPPDLIPRGQRHLWPDHPEPVCVDHAAELKAKGFEVLDADPARTPLKCRVILDPGS